MVQRSTVLKMSLVKRPFFHPVELDGQKRLPPNKTVVAPGVTYYPNYVSLRQMELIESEFPVSTLVRLPIRGTFLRRAKHWVGDVTEDGQMPDYKFPGVELMPQMGQWTEGTAAVRDQILASHGRYCTQAIVTNYEDGTVGIGFHQDKHDDEFFILSMGATRELEFALPRDTVTSSGKPKRVFDVKFKIGLKQGSLLHVSKEANRAYWHGIPPKYTKRARKHGSRTSVVFRPIVKFSKTH